MAATNTNSLVVSFSVGPFNVHHQNTTELNPHAPEFIPPVLGLHRGTTTTTTSSTSSVFFYYHQHYPCHPLPPPPPPPPQCHYYYFQPLFPVNPPAHFTHFVPHAPPPQRMLTWTQPCVDQVQQESETENRGGRRNPVSVGVGGCRQRRTSCGGRWRKRGSVGGGGGVWRVKGEQRSDQTEPIRSKTELAVAERVENRAVNESQCRYYKAEEDSSEWRMVKYRACKKIGKKFAIQPVDKSVNKTTVMIRNIPSRYTREMMLTFLDRHCMEVNTELKQSCDPDEEECVFSAYDFFYMPMDFKTGLNKSYAFVNFTTPEAVWRFHSNCDSQKWELFESNKIRQIALAKLQGAGELINHFERTAFACDRDEFLPVYFQPPRDGSADDVERVTTIIGKRVS